MLRLFIAGPQLRGVKFFELLFILLYLVYVCPSKRSFAPLPLNIFASPW